MTGDGTDKIKQDIDKANAGDAPAAHRVDNAGQRKPEAAAAAEQEAADGPAGRGLSR